MTAKKSKAVKKPWPTKDAMQQVYAKGLWGTNHSDFYSGEGSHLENITQPYIDSVNSFLKSFSKPLVVCDLGCGDFNVGKQLIRYTGHYIAVDIVPELIAYNRANFEMNNLSFHCMDIAKEPLPVADCALVRQVLQHLSNAEIQAVLEKLYQYSYIILTEHLPSDVYTPNVDIISGQGTRLKKKSGVDVLKPPFNFEAKEKRVLATVVLEDKSIIQTTLYILNGHL